MSQFTILYIGFSFSDYYLNDLRASLLTMMGRDTVNPVAYSIIDGKEEWEVNFFLKHEGATVLFFIGSMMLLLLTSIYIYIQVFKC
jgi:hypothetical protein